MSGGDTDARPRAAAVCGVKNSGKTALIEKLVRNLTGRGVKVAVIKHDGHDFDCDIPGTDSDRFRRAGAYGTAVYSKNRSFVHRIGAGDGAGRLLGQFPEADLILLEGLKDSDLPKAEVIRREISAEPVSNPHGRFLIVTDWEPGRFDGRTAGFEEIGLIADAVWNAARPVDELIEGLQKKETR